MLARASLSVCQTSFHCEVVSGHIPLLSASAQRSCAAAPWCHSPPLWPHPHPPVGACTGSEAPIPGTPAEGSVLSKRLINTNSSQSINANQLVEVARTAAGSILTCLMPGDMVWVLGLRNEKLSTTIWLVAMRVVTHMTKIRYLRRMREAAHQSAGSD